MIKLILILSCCILSNCEQKPTEFKVNDLTTEQERKDNLEEKRKVKANREAAKQMKKTHEKNLEQQSE